MATVIPLFEQAHPGVKVNFVEQPFGDMSKKYLVALADASVQSSSVRRSLYRGNRAVQFHE
jgi:hypothetical protein